MENSQPTIAALATAPAPAGIAVIRMSGPQTKTAIKALFRSEHNPITQPRRLVLGELIDYKSSLPIDRALAVYMPAPHSFTGEDVGEFQFHGSPLLVQKILRSLFAFGITPAEPGEFTRRAFLNGKMDLVQAEAIADLINASSEQALKIAGEQLKGRFSDVIVKIGDPLRDALAELEAGIDFPEEGITPPSLELIGAKITTARGRIADLLNTYSFGHLVREGFRVLLCGAPNVGKSSILNMLIGAQRAIVTEISGTTRDLIEEQTMIGGFRFVICDSAGITETTDRVEQIGVELAKERVAWADLVVLVTDATDTSERWREVAKLIQGQARKIWMVVNKIDLNPKAFGAIFCDSNICQQNFYVSVKTNAGVQSFIDALVDEVRLSLPRQNEGNTIVTNERHRHCLEEAEKSLSTAVTAIAEKLPVEIVSAELRRGLNSLDELIGRTATEDILGRIFSKFCIGK